MIGTYDDKRRSPRGIAFDGTHMWVTNFDHTVTRYRLDGTQAGTFNVGLSPINMAFDGTNMWVANYGDGTVTKLRASDGKVLGTFNAGNAEGLRSALLSTDRTLWISGGPFVVEMRPSDGKLLLQQQLVGSLGGWVLTERTSGWQVTRRTWLTNCKNLRRRS